MLDKKSKIEQRCNGLFYTRRQIDVSQVDYTRRQIEIHKSTGGERLGPETPLKHIPKGKGFME